MQPATGCPARAHRRRGLEVGGGQHKGPGPGAGAGGCALRLPEQPGTRGLRLRPRNGKAPARVGPAGHNSPSALSSLGPYDLGFQALGFLERAPKLTCWGHQARRTARLGCQVGRAWGLAGPWPGEGSTYQARCGGRRPRAAGAGAEQGDQGAAGRPRYQRGPGGAESGLMVCGGRLLFAGWMTGRRQPGGDVSGEPGRRWPSLPPAAAVCFYFDITLVGGRVEAGAPRRGRRVPGARAQPPWSSHWRLVGGGHSGRLSLLASTPAHSRPGRGAYAGMHPERPAVCLRRLSPGPPETWAHALTHARTQMPAPPPPTHLQSQGRTYIRAHTLAHSVWMDILRQEVWVTPTCTHANVA